MSRRAIGIVRVSEAKGREGDTFASPKDQRARIGEACERDSIELVDVREEIDVSGGTPLEDRDGLRGAVEAIEEGGAEILMVGYFDRLVRSLRVQDEVVSRVEAAGGRVVAIDFGEVTGATAAQWLSGTMIGAVSEYYRRSVKERVGEAQALAVARGVAPWDHVTLGYVRPVIGRNSDGRPIHGPFEPDPNAAPAVAEAFEMRAGGATIKEVREWLASQGHRLTYRRVQTLLASRVVLGELHFGKLHNTSAHEPIVSRELYAAVQRVQVPRGRRAKSDRLLARVGVLRCGTCNGRLVIGTVRKGQYPFYRCSPTSDCPRRVTVSAEKVEGLVVAKVKEILADLQGRASAESHAREAAAAVERAQADLDAAVRAFVGLEDEASVRDRLAELRASRDGAQAALDQLGGLSAAESISVADWDLLTLDERRALIRATIESVTVAPGRGAGRISIEAFG